MTKIWKDIIGYEGLYQISDTGEIKSLAKMAGRSRRKERILKTYLDKDGYVKVILCKNNKTHFLSVHRLLAEVFIPNPFNYEQINHKDENKKNNNLTNLEWCTCKYNINYGTRTKRAMEKRYGIESSN